MTHITELTRLSAAAELREHGHRLIDAMADYLEGVEDRPVSTALNPPELARGFSLPLPIEGGAAEDIWDDVWNTVVADSIKLHHPMYMGHQVAPTLPHAVLADALTSLLNQSLAVWEMSPTGTLVEAQVVRWLSELLGYPASADGTLVSGGSAANLSALLAAREARFPGVWTEGATAMQPRPVLLVSPHAHYSVERAAGLMGMGSGAVVALPEKDGVIDAARIQDALDDLHLTGRVPLAIVATAGSTATGQFDPLDALADFAAKAGIWLHVDAAHGASFLLSRNHRHRLKGIERADSVAWDPHKMMFMPMSLGVVLLKERRHLDSAFQQSAPYLFHVRPGEDRSRDTGMRTLQCSRRFDALKLWVSMRHYGVQHFGDLIDRTVHNTHYLYDSLEEAPDFEAMHLPESNILCFRHLPAKLGGATEGAVDRFQAELRARFNGSGEGWITATVLRGRRVLRVTLINPATEHRHVDALLEGLRRTGEQIEV